MGHFPAREGKDLGLVKQGQHHPPPCGLLEGPGQWPGGVWIQRLPLAAIAGLPVAQMQKAGVPRPGQVWEEPTPLQSPGGGRREEG